MFVHEGLRLPTMHTRLWGHQRRRAKDLGLGLPLPVFVPPCHVVFVNVAHLPLVRLHEHLGLYIIRLIAEMSTQRSKRPDEEKGYGEHCSPLKCECWLCQGFFAGEALYKNTHRFFF